MPAQSLTHDRAAAEVAEANKDTEAGHPRRATSLSQALALQDLAVQDCLKPDTKPSIRAALMRAWSLLDARACAWRMRPLPKPLDTTKLKPKRKSAPAERLDAEPPEPDASTS